MFSADIFPSLSAAGQKGAIGVDARILGKIGDLAARGDRDRRLCVLVEPVLIAGAGGKVACHGARALMRDGKAISAHGHTLARHETGDTGAAATGKGNHPGDGCSGPHTIMAPSALIAPSVVA